MGKKITVRTDSLTVAFVKDLRKNRHDRLFRWSLVFDSVPNLDFVHIPGRQNLLADLLSRRPYPSPQPPGKVEAELLSETMACAVSAFSDLYELFEDEDERFVDSDVDSLFEDDSYDEEVGDLSSASEVSRDDGVEFGVQCRYCTACGESLSLSYKGNRDHDDVILCETESLASVSNGEFKSKSPVSGLEDAIHSGRDASPVSLDPADLPECCECCCIGYGCPCVPIDGFLYDDSEAWSPRLDPNESKICQNSDLVSTLGMESVSIPAETLSEKNASQVCDENFSLALDVVNFPQLNFKNVSKGSRTPAPCGCNPLLFSELSHDVSLNEHCCSVETKFAKSVCVSKNCAVFEPDFSIFDSIFASHADRLKPVDDNKFAQSSFTERTCLSHIPKINLPPQLVDAVSLTACSVNRSKSPSIFEIPNAINIQESQAHQSKVGSVANAVSTCAVACCTQSPASLGGSCSSAAVRPEFPITDYGTIASARASLPACQTHDPGCNVLLFGTASGKVEPTDIFAAATCLPRNVASSSEADSASAYFSPKYAIIPESTGSRFEQPERACCSVLGPEPSAWFSRPGANGMSVSQVPFEPLSRPEPRHQQSSGNALLDGILPSTEWLHACPKFLTPQPYAQITEPVIENRLSAYSAQGHHSTASGLFITRPESLGATQSVDISETDLERSRVISACTQLRSSCAALGASQCLCPGSSCFPD